MALVRGEGSQVQSLLDWRSELERQAAGARFRLTNIQETLEEDRRIFESHLQMKIDAAADLAASEALIGAINDDLQELAGKEGEDGGALHEGGTGDEAA
jgi:hypothetical protein